MNQNTLHAMPANDLELALARAVGGPDTGPYLRLDPDNSGTWVGTRPVGVPYAVRLAHETADGPRFHIFALDFDVKDREPSDVERDCARVGALLHRVGIPHTIWQSGPSGGRHLFAPTPACGLPPALVRKLADRLTRSHIASSLDMSGIMNAKSGAIRPPLSLHRIEGRSEPIEPRSPVEALRILQTSPSLDLYALLAESIATPATAGQRQARQEELRASAPYSPPPVTEDRSAWVFGVACELVRRGEDFESYFSIVMAVADENPHLRDRVISRGGRPYLEREWKNACSKADSGDDRAALTRRDTAEERAVADARSSLARAQTELDRGAYRTFEAIVRLLCDTGATTVFGLSVRSAGELSGQSRTTANGALKELMRRSMIMEADVERAFASDSRRFELQPPSAWEVHPANRSPGGAWLSRVIDDPQLHPKYDIWDDAEMGEIGRLIFGFLRHHGGDESPSTQVVAAEVGITPKTASKYLNRLHEAHMIHRSGPGWVAEQVDVELKARDLGIPRHGDVRARMHNHERGDDNLRRSLDRLAKKTIPGQTLTRHGHLSDEQPSVAA